MPFIRNEVRAEFLHSIAVAEQAVESCGGYLPSILSSVEKSLRYYENGVWYEMRDRGIYWWWIWLLLIAVVLGGIFGTFTTAPILSVVNSVGRRFLESLVLITVAYYLFASICQWTTGRTLRRIEEHLSERVQ
jgi:ABC-type multidrug transport system fused ATPase/permease subunit